MTEEQALKFLTDKGWTLKACKGTLVSNKKMIAPDEFEALQTLIDDWEYAFMGD